MFLRVFEEALETFANPQNFGKWQKCVWFFFCCKIFFEIKISLTKRTLFALWVAIISVSLQTVPNKCAYFFLQRKVIKCLSQNKKKSTSIHLKFFHSWWYAKGFSYFDICKTQHEAPKNITFVCARVHIWAFNGSESQK